MPRFKLVPFDQIAAPKGGNYLVRHLVPAGGLTIVWGPPKSGKSFWVFDLAMHIAQGLDYRGKRVKQGNVAYIACEGEAGLAARVQAYRQEQLGDMTSPVPFYLMATGLDLARDNQELINAIRGQLGDNGCALTIIDTLARSIGGSESSDDDMRAYIAGAAHLQRELQTAVAIVHHCGHNDNRMRGWSGLLGALDCEIAITRDASDAIVAKVESAKDAPEGTTVRSRLRSVEIGTDDDGEPITSCVIEDADSEATGSANDAVVKLSDSTKRALELLYRTIDRMGEPAPPSAHIPATATVVRYEAWREYFYAGYVTSSEPGDEKKQASAKRQAFNRASDKLTAIGRIGVWQEWVWLT